ncbi:MAG TPA: AmmeMemoRadiSam system radical SAM enzyme [Bryobacteraceae bacterium]|nr:AmmeMemoRadiSam system radical SAM enzyme [Bryobacteraceae bacterium]HPT29154.1 AmmeMemoRadiSam system radical SAM enzyme [Bryobacteraceae bacterium]
MTLAEELASRTREGELYESLEGDRIRCFACGHRCPISDGLPGVCKVRFNRGGKLMVPYGYVSGLNCDPIEKKPFYHALPGTRAMSFGMLGCDLHCGYCQNWVTSQALRDPDSWLEFRPMEPARIVEQALRQKAASVISTYNEPLVTSEWAVAVFREARRAGLTTGFVSNGNATPEVLDYLRPWVDLFKVDLKSMDDRRYHELGGRLKPVLDSIEEIHRMGFWMEVVTLLVPGFNDSPAELEALTGFLAGVSPDIPWHVSAFHPDYKMTGPRRTTAEMLERAAGIGRAAGLHYVYAGNLPGRVGGLENTQCPGCGVLLVERYGFEVVKNNVAEGGICPSCRRGIPGYWRPGGNGGSGDDPEKARFTP